MITGKPVRVRAAVGNGEKWGTLPMLNLNLGLATPLLAEALGAGAFMMYLGDNLLRNPYPTLFRRFPKLRQAPDELVLVRGVKAPASLSGEIGRQVLR